MILSLDQKELPWVGEENRQALAGTEKLASGWKIRYVYYGGVELGVADRSDGWRNRVRLFEVLASTGFSLSDFPAFEWCEARGSGWYLPALDELKGLWTLIGGAEEDGKFSLGDYEAARKRFNAYMTQYGGDPYPRLPSFRFWSSTEKDAGRAYGCDVGCSPDIVWRAYRKPYGEILDEGGGKASEWSVRAFTSSDRKQNTGGPGIFPCSALFNAEIRLSLRREFLSNHLFLRSRAGSPASGVSAK